MCICQHSLFQAYIIVFKICMHLFFPFVPLFKLKMNLIAKFTSAEPVRIEDGQILWGNRPRGTGFTFLLTLVSTGGSMLISAVCCFFLFFGNSESAMIGWQCLFCGTSIAAWNALDVITVELYPTNQRSVLPRISL